MGREEDVPGRNVGVAHCLVAISFKWMVDPLVYTLFSFMCMCECIFVFICLKYLRR